MVATSNSVHQIRHYDKPVARSRPVPFRRILTVLTALVLEVSAVAGKTEDPPARTNLMELVLARYHRAYADVRARSLAETNSAEVFWLTGKACLDLAEAVTTSRERERFAEEGLAACRKAIVLAPGAAQAHYYFALNCGQMARVKGLGALKLIGEMERALLRTCGIDETLDFAGPHRALGMLYLGAPGWPISLGSRKKGRVHLERAVELAPGYPGNRLFWLNGLLDWDEFEAAEAEYRTVESLMESARASFTGDAWQAAWLEWEESWDRIQQRMVAVRKKAARGR